MYVSERMSLCLCVCESVRKREEYRKRKWEESGGVKTLGSAQTCNVVDRVLNFRNSRIQTALNCCANCLLFEIARQ